MSRPSPTYHPYDGYAAPTSSNNSSHNRTPSDQSFLPDRPAQSSNGRNYSSERGGKKRGGRRGRRGDSPPSRGGEGPGPSRSGGRGGHGRHDPYERSSGRGGSRGGRRRSWEDRQEPHPSSYPVAGPPLRVEPVVRATGANQQSQNPYPYSREQGPPAQPSYYGQPPQPQPPQPVVVGYGSSQGPPPSTYSQYSAPPPSSSDYSRYAPPPAQGYSPTISYAPPPPAPLPPPPPALPLSRPPPHFALRDFPCRAIRITSRGSAVDRLDLGTVFSITERDAGEIKKWWKETDRAGTILGISFWDTRTALKAREIFERWDTRAERLDVDFGMPIPERNLGRAGPEHDQGTLFCFAAGVSGMATNPDLTDNYFYSIFAPFGELREIRPFKSQTNARFIEFYDSRACYEAHDKMSGVSFGQPPARWDIKFAWDLVVSARDGIAAPTPLPGPPIHRGPPKTPSPDLYGGERRISHHPYPQHESHHHQQPPHLSQSYQHGPPTYQQPPPHRPSSPPPQPQYSSRPPQLPHQQPSPDSYHAASRTSGSEYSQWPGSLNARPSSNPYESRSPRQAQNGGYGSPPNNGQPSQRPPAVSAWEAKRNQDAEKERERLEQAQKVQQLLAALKKPNESGSPAAPQSAPPPPPAAPAAQGFQGILDFLAQQKQQG